MSKSLETGQVGSPSPTDKFLKRQEKSGIVPKEVFLREINSSERPHKSLREKISLPPSLNLSGHPFLPDRNRWRSVCCLGEWGGRPIEVGKLDSEEMLGQIESQLIINPQKKITPKTTWAEVCLSVSKKLRGFSLPVLLICLGNTSPDDFWVKVEEPSSQNSRGKKCFFNLELGGVEGKQSLSIYNCEDYGNFTGIKLPHRDEWLYFGLLEVHSTYVKFAYLAYIINEYGRFRNCPRVLILWYPKPHVGVAHRGSVHII